MPIIIAIQPHLIRINHRIIVFHGNFLHGTIVTFCLLFGDILGYHLVFKPIFQRCWSSNSWPKFQHVSVITHQFIRIPRHIRTRADKAHLFTKHIPQSRQFIQLALMDKRSIRSSESIIKEDSSPKDVTLKKAKKSSVRKRARSLCRPLTFSATSPTESPP